MRRSLLILSVLALVSGACGGGGPDPQENPQAALESAFDRLLEAEGTTSTMSLISTVQSMVAIGDGALTQEDAQKILDSSITITGRNTEDPEDVQSEISATIAGVERAVEIKQIAADVYLRASVRELMETFGADPDEADRFAADGNEAGFTWAEPAVNGEWLHLSGLEQLGEQFGMPLSGAGAREQLKLMRRFRERLFKDAEVEPGDKEGPGDHLIVKVPIRKVLQEMQEVFTSMEAFFPAGAFDPSAVPDIDARFDVWVQDDFPTQLEIDFITLVEQLAEDAEPAPPSVEMSMRITIEEFDGDIEAPEDTTKVDTQQLMGIFGGTVPGQVPGGEPSSTDICEQLKGAPPDVIEQFAEECPELQPS